MNLISLIICTKNRDEMITDVLNSAVNQSFDNYEVLIIDQSTNDKTNNILKNYPQFKYIKSATTGLSNSRNEGIKYSKGEILVFVDDDVVFEKDYLEKIFECFNNSPLKPDFIGGKTHIQYLSPKPEWISGSLLGILAFSDFGDKECFYETHLKHVPYGCNMAIKKECLEKIGNFSNIVSEFNKNLTENEDVIVGNKLKKMGLNVVYCPNMFLYHKMPESRLNYTYYKKRYFSQGASDAFIYYHLGEYTFNNIPAKIILHLTRLLESSWLRFIKKDSEGLFYQKLRFYYNLGYIKLLFELLIKQKRVNN